MTKKFNKEAFECSHALLIDRGVIDEDYILNRLIDGDLEVCEPSHPDAVVLEGESFLVSKKWQRTFIKLLNKHTTTKFK